MNSLYRRHAHVADAWWHFCVNCSSWPRRDYVGVHEPPTDGDYCHECAARHAMGTCASGCGRQAAALRAPARAGAV